MYLGLATRLPSSNFARMLVTNVIGRGMTLRGMVPHTLSDRPGARGHSMLVLAVMCIVNC